MKTSVELDEEKVKLAKKLSLSPTLKDLIDKALDTLIASARRNKMSEMLGTRFFSGDFKAMRKDRGRSSR